MTKICRTCEKEKLFIEFFKSKTNKHGIANICKICDLAKRQKWRENNREKLNATTREYKIRVCDKVREQSKTYRENNREKVRAATRKSTKSNPGKVRARTAKRRAQKLQATPKWLSKEHILDIQKFYKEADRLTKETDILYEVDHIVPLQGKNVRGLHVPWNLQILTAFENRSKGNK